MIIDTIDNLLFYCQLNPRIKQVVDFIDNNDLYNIEDGVVEIDGKDVFANFCSCIGKTKQEAQLETHNQMLDIQVPISCTEIMGFIPRIKLPNNKYDADLDLTLYDNEPEQYINVNPGEFIIFFPQDGHAPCITDKKIIKKVIFKVKI